MNFHVYHVSRISRILLWSSDDSERNLVATILVMSSILDIIAKQAPKYIFFNFRAKWRLNSFVSIDRMEQFCRQNEFINS